MIIEQTVVLNSFDRTERVLLGEVDRVIDWIHEDVEMHPINEIKWTAPLKMIEQTHKHPGNSNIKVSSTRSNIVQVYNNNKWENMHVDDVLRGSS